MAIEIVDFPSKNGWIFHSYVKLPEGTCHPLLRFFGRMNFHVIFWGWLFDSNLRAFSPWPNRLYGEFSMLWTRMAGVLSGQVQVHIHTTLWCGTEWTQPTNRFLEYRLNIAKMTTDWCFPRVLALGPCDVLYRTPRYWWGHSSRVLTPPHRPVPKDTIGSRHCFSVKTGLLACGFQSGNVGMPSGIFWILLAYLRPQNRVVGLAVISWKIAHW